MINHLVGWWIDDDDDDDNDNDDDDLVASSFTSSSVNLSIHRDSGMPGWLDRCPSPSPVAADSAAAASACRKEACFRTSEDSDTEEW